MTEQQVAYEIEDQERLAAAEAERAEMLAKIAKALSAADRHTLAIQAAIEALEEAGTFEYAPLGEQWTGRGKGNKTEYLYLTFRRDRYGGTYQGPGKRKRVYVGVKEAKIEAARAKVARTVRRDELRAALRGHEGFCGARARELRSLAGAAERWTRVDVATGVVRLGLPEGDRVELQERDHV